MKRGRGRKGEGNEIEQSVKLNCKWREGERGREVREANETEQRTEIGDRESTVGGTHLQQTAFNTNQLCH